MTPFALLSVSSPLADLFTGVVGGMIVLWILAIAATIFWLWMLVDALVTEPTPAEKLLWFVVIFLLHFIGALIYFIVRRSSRPRATPY